MSSYANSFPQRECGNAVAARGADVVCCVLAVGVAWVGCWALGGERRVVLGAEERKKREEIWLGSDDFGREIQMMY